MGGLHASARCRDSGVTTTASPTVRRASTGRRSSCSTIPDQPILITQPAGLASVRQSAAGLDAGSRPRTSNRVDTRLLRRAEPVQRRQDAARLLDGGQPRQDRRRRRGVRAVHDARRSCTSTASPTDFNGAVGNQANSSCPAGYTLQPEHPHRRRHAWRADDRLPVGPLRLRQRLLRHRRPRRVVDVAGVRRDDVTRRATQVPATLRASADADGRAGPEPAGNPMPNWAPTRYVPGRRGGRPPTTGRTPAAARRRRPRARARASSRTSSATSAACRTTTTTRSPTTSGTSPATGR